MVLSKKRALTLAACLILSLAAFFSTKDQTVVSPMRRLASSYTTTSTRSSSVNSYCSGLTRSTLVDFTLTSQYNVFNAQMSTMFSLNGYFFLHSALPSSSVFCKVIPHQFKLRPKIAPLNLDFSLDHSSLDWLLWSFWVPSFYAVAHVLALVLQNAAENVKTSSILSVSSTGQWVL